MSTTVVVGYASEDQLIDATFTSDSDPLATYSLDTFGARNPAARVRFGVTDLVLTATTPQPIRGDILVIPCCNLDEGDEMYTVLRLTNGAGLSVAVPVPGIAVDGIPKTIILDLTEVVPNPTTRTSNVWNLVIEGNSVDVIFGGLIAIYQKRVIEAMQWGLQPRRTQHTTETVNDHGSRYRINYRTKTEALGYTLSVEPSEYLEARDWHAAQAGSVEPGLLWVQLDEVGPLVGTLEAILTGKQRDGMFLYDVSGTFTELSKGKPL